MEGKIGNEAKTVHQCHTRVPTDYHVNEVLFVYFCEVVTREEIAVADPSEIQ